MPLQNRVTPQGQLEAASARGAWLGNRGILHDEQKRVLVPWRHKAWVTCKLEFRGRRRDVFSRNNYSELFFLDEATAFSAGHRPCAECRRERYNEFKTAWCAANPILAGASNPPIAHIDKQLHSERAVYGGGKVTFQERLPNLPSGTFVEIEGNAYLLWQRRLWLWSHQGYIEPSAIVPSALVTVLTPASVVAVFRYGFKPQVHESACS